MLRKICSVFMLVLVIRAEFGFAQEPGKTIAPFIGDYTIGIGHLDAQKVDLDLLEARVSEIIKASKLDDPIKQEGLNQLMFIKVAAREWMNSFTQAGGRQLFLITDLNSLMSKAPGSVLISADKQSDANTFVQLLTGGNAPGPRGELPAAWQWPQAVENLDGTIFLGTKEAIKRFQEGKPAQRPEIAAALAATGDSALHLLLVPTADMRRVLEGLWPTLPPHLGSVSSTVLTHGVMWASVGVDFTPKFSFKLVIQSQDAESAKALAALFKTVYDDLRKDHGFNRDIPEGAKLLDTLMPKVEGDRLTLSLDDDQLSAIAITQIVPAVHRARISSMRMVSMNNMRQILVAGIMYADQNKGEWPNDLKALARFFPANGNALINPTKPADKSSYIYLMPNRAALANPAGTIVLHEEFSQTDEGLGVGFADGHVEWMSVDQFQKRLPPKQ